MTRMAGQVAIVTGGSRGIGFATVEHLVTEGARVVFCGRDPDAGEGALGRLARPEQACFVACDATSEQAVAAVVERCVERFGPPTALVSNLGMSASFDAVTTTTDEWDEALAVNLTAAWLAAKHVIPHMLAGGRGGAIVNVSSIHALATTEGSFAYAAAKSALVGLTRSLALDYASAGVRVNCVCPGFTRTRLVGEALDESDDPVQAERRLVAAIPLQRLASPGEIADAICYLASPAASYVTGSVLVVDGGLTARRSGASI